MHVVQGEHVHTVTDRTCSILQAPSHTRALFHTRSATHALIEDCSPGALAALAKA